MLFILTIFSMSPKSKSEVTLLGYNYHTVKIKNVCPVFKMLIYYLDQIKGTKIKSYM